MLLFAALAVRGAVVWRLSPQLSEDRDGYFALAEALAAGRGFVNPETGRPTAYRPPAYPLLIAALNRLGGRAAALGVVQCLLGTATVGATWWAGRRPLGERGALLAAGAVAVDPLLLLYTSQAMTETLFTAIVSALLALLMTAEPWGRSRQVLAGLAFGSAALCRPTVWAWFVLGFVWKSWCEVRAAGWQARAWPWRYRLAGATALVVLSPWVVRNVVVMGRPIVTTTHGGYTLLLANNPVVYREEVDKPWGVTWEDASKGRRQSDWYADMRSRMRAELGPNADEVAVDRWESSEARRHIRDEPTTFLRSCVFRLRRLWNVAPLGPAAARFPAWVVWGVGAWYAVLFTAAVAGALRIAWAERIGRQPNPPVERSPPYSWSQAFLLILSISMVHAVYWSNARMRAPAMPAVSLLAARAGFRRS